MDKILISRCLLGEPVRYDGKSKGITHPLLNTWQQQGRLVSICPEMAGGLPCPRPAAEIIGGTGTDVYHRRAVIATATGEDLTLAFLAGAAQALQLCQQHQIRFALLKSRSPSCATKQHYNGHFSNQLTEGAGVTAAQLQQHGIRCFDELELDLLAPLLDKGQ